MYTYKKHLSFSLSISLFILCILFTNCKSEQPIINRFETLLNQYFPESFFMPRAVNRKLLDRYNEQELTLIYADLQERQKALFSGASKINEYIATAGAPCAGKSMLLERTIAAFPEKYVYVDPDRATLLHMTNTYKKDLANKARTIEEAYNHWRDASNFIANLFLAKALKEGYAIAHGTTMTSPMISKLFSSLKTDYGRTIHLLHVTCDEFVRKASEEQRRAGGVVQCTWEDFATKMNMFCDRLPDYLKVDHVDFYYRSSMHDYTLAAMWQTKKLTILNNTALQHIRAVHDESKQSGYFDSCLALT
ncbi:ATP-binding protein [Candidatus Dependentiae bacterium]|nr:ATP-binding protein [Candidatus Dependentiae bacterium]